MEDKQADSPLPQGDYDTFVFWYDQMWFLFFYDSYFNVYI